MEKFKKMSIPSKSGQYVKLKNQVARNKSGQARTRDESKPTDKRPGSNGRNQSAIQQRNLGASQQTMQSVHKKANYQS